MPFSIDYEWETFEDRDEHYIPPQFLQTRTFNEEVSRVERGWNDPDHREKPDDLIWNITAQPSQWTEENISSYVKGLISYGWYQCFDPGHGPGCWKRPYTDHTYVKRRQQTGGVSEYFGNWPDWATPLRLRVKDEAINLGATIAEYRQSVNMFGSAARGVVNAWRAFRKGKRLKKRTTCDVSAAHLIHDYGVAPLMSDMYDSYEALRLRLERPVYRRYFFKQKDETYKENFEIYHNSLIQEECDITIDKDQYIAANVLLNLDRASMFTLGNPLEIGWELVPYSFVIDWFIPIGDALIALDALKAVDRINASVTRKCHQFDEYTLKVKDYYGTERYDSLNHGSTNFTSHRRDVYETIPLPSIPSYDLNASINKLLNATSLLHVARGCKGKRPKYTRRSFGR